LAIAYLLILVQVDPSFAHRPYFTQVEKIVLPDGQIGEMRLLHGDGIIVSDPVRLIVLDSAGRLIGYSREDFGPYTIICSVDKRCLGYKHDHRLILEFNATEPFTGPVVTDGISADLWNKAREVSMNIHMRRPTLQEYVWANITLAKFYFFYVVFIVVVGLLVGLVGWLLWGIGTGGSVGILAKFVFWIFMLSIEFVLLVISLVPVILAGHLSGIVWLVSLCFGVFFVLVVRQIARFVRHKSKRPAQA
jgi:hypothetical protein